MILDTTTDACNDRGLYSTGSVRQVVAAKAGARPPHSRVSFFCFLSFLFVLLFLFLNDFYNRYYYYYYIHTIMLYRIIIIIFTKH